MKTDAINFNTTKSVQEVVNIIRNAASSMKAEITKLDEDPFGNIGGYVPAIAVGLSGSNILGFGPRGWGMHVYVTDLGSSCEIELIALGDGVMQKMSGRAFFDLGLGKRHRDKLANMLM